MTKEPIISKSPFPYQLGIFIIVNLWAFMCFEVAQYQLVTLYETPFGWIGWSNLIILTLLPVIGLCSWKLKDRVQFQGSEWDFKIREVSFKEFGEMVANYNSGYRYLLSSIDYLVFLILCSCYVLLITLPFFLMRSAVLIIQMTPIILALIVVIFGLLFSYFTFKYIPNSATPDFPSQQPRKLKKSISFLIGIPGIFWAGVRLTIGEAGGFYTLRNPIPIARIEGIEGTARLECHLDSSGNISRIEPIFESANFKPSKDITAITVPVTTVKATHLVRSMIQEYIQHSGGEEILEDVLEDIDIFLRKIRSHS